MRMNARQHEIAEASASGTASGQRENLLTIVNKYLYPSEGGVMLSSLTGTKGPRK